jgi:muramoyltetrapeptide carboxypeptidase
VSASGPLRGDSDVERAEANVRALGCEAVRGANVLARRGYLAGTDDERLYDLQWALDDDRIDAVWCVRGGYGMTRILPSVSLERFDRKPKAVIGYSDVTALHSAVSRRSGVVTFHTHTARAKLPSMSAASLRAAVTRTNEPCGVWEMAQPIVDGRVTGRLAGGNLSLLAALCGTAHAMDGTGAIIVLEDVNETSYRVDRMLRQLEQAGAFLGCVGLAIGQFTDAPIDENDGAPTIAQLIEEMAIRMRVPCLANLPIGHIADQWTLPMGAMASLDVRARSLTVAESFPSAFTT